jgi:SAM-dependent methyltransferase
MTRKERLIWLNDAQRSFYDAKASGRSAQNPKANVATNLWARLRGSLQKLDREAGVRGALLDRHREWLGDLSDKDVLDLGCFFGNSLSVEIAKASRSYLGIDLSAQAVAELRKTLRGVPSARVEAIDFLAADYCERFDVIYAHSVLHHFDDFDLICAELHRALRPGGVVISVDPLQSDPINRLARWLYRPFQTDRDWEWPFTGRNFKTIRRYFAIEAVQGFRGLSRLGLLAGPAAARWGLGWDLRHANRFGVHLGVCWMVALKLRKP